jgi:hypothetical protein
MSRSHVDDGPDLDRPVLDGRQLPSGLDRLVQVRALDDVVATELFLSSPRAARRSPGFAFGLADGRGLVGVGQLITARINPSPGQLVLLVSCKPACWSASDMVFHIFWSA